MHGPIWALSLPARDSPATRKSGGPAVAPRLGTRV